MGIHNILALSMNPHESAGGFIGENKSPLIPMTHESEYPWLTALSYSLPNLNNIWVKVQR